MDTQTIIILGLGATCIAAVVAVALAPTRNERTSKRAAAVLGGGAAARAATTKRGAAEGGKDRRKHVQESLKAIEEKQKKKKPKLSLAKTLEQSGLSMTPRDFYMMSAICCLVMAGLGLLTGQSMMVIGLFAVVGGLGVPRWIINLLRKRRQKKFVAEFSNALDIIVRGVRSGLPVNDCMRIIANEGRPPVSDEFHLLTEGIRLGLSMEQSLDRMCERMPLQEVNFFAIVLIIQQKTGGNLAEALANLSKVIRSRKQMQGKVKALAAEAQASAFIIGSLPFFVMMMVQFMSPDYLQPLFSTSIGHLILMGAGLWMSIGILVMKNMIAIKV